MFASFAAALPAASTASRQLYGASDPAMVPDEADHPLSDLDRDADTAGNMAAIGDLEASHDDMQLVSQQKEEITSELNAGDLENVFENLEPEDDAHPINHISTSTLKVANDIHPDEHTSISNLDSKRDQQVTVSPASQASIVNQDNNDRASPESDLPHDSDKARVRGANEEDVTNDKGHQDSFDEELQTTPGTLHAGRGVLTEALRTPRPIKNNNQKAQYTRALRNSFDRTRTASTKQAEAEEAARVATRPRTRSAAPSVLAKQVVRSTTSATPAATLKKGMPRTISKMSQGVAKQKAAHSTRQSARVASVQNWKGEKLKLTKGEGVVMVQQNDLDLSEYVLYT
jgi:hypothetical protein